MAPSSRFSAPTASSRGRPSLRQRSRTLRNELLNPSARVSKSLTCNDAPASAPTGPGVVLGTSSSNSTATAPQASLIAALGGWRITLAGSRFPSSAEQRYAAIEREALAVPWGLEQTRYFTQGCDDLVFVTNHKPLVEIFGDRTLDEISNSCLFCLKQRTLPWRFRIAHLQGTSNHATDAISKHPSPSESDDLLDLSSETEIAESALMASIRLDAHELANIPWSLLAQETTTDASLSHLLKLGEQGVTNFDRTDPALSNLWPICQSVYSHEGVIVSGPGSSPVISSPRNPQAPLRYTPGNLCNGTMCMRHCLLARDVEGHPRNERRMSGLQQKCTITGCNPTPTFFTTVDTVQDSFR